MDRDPDVFKQVFSEFKSYVPVLAALFFVFAIETRARLRIWHAVRVLPHLEKAPVEGDCEGVSVEKAASIRAQRKLAKKLSWFVWIAKYLMSLSLFGLVLCEQIVTRDEWQGLSRKQKGIPWYIGRSAEPNAESDSQSSSVFGWYYHLISGQLEWPRAYYILSLFPASVSFVSVPSSFLSGSRYRCIFRGTDDRACIVLSFSTIKDRSAALRFASRLVISLLVEILLASGALLFQNPICTAIVFASMVHFFVYNAVFKAAIMLGHVVRGILVFAGIATILLCGLVSTSTVSFPIQLLRTIPPDDVTSWDWSGLIVSALVCGSSLNLIAFSYRMDHAFARPEELLVEPSDAVQWKDKKTGAKLLGMRIPFYKRRSTPDKSARLPPSEGRRCLFRRGPRWAKTYFYTSLHAWFLAYVLVAYLKVGGYISTDAESATIYASFFFLPIWAAAITLRAALKGRNELEKVWAYKEDWVGRGEKVLTFRKKATAAPAKRSAKEGKVSTSEEGRVEAKDEKLEEGKELVSEEQRSESEKEGSILVSAEQMHDAEVVVEE